MLRSMRAECGLGNPPSIFTTNASQSMNALLKHKVDYKKHQLPSFIDKVKELVDEQKHEVERAIINCGKWQLRSQYRYLEVQESIWFRMNAQQRQKHISKVHSAVLSDVQSNESVCSSSYQLELRWYAICGCQYCCQEYQLTFYLCRGNLD